MMIYYSINKLLFLAGYLTFDIRTSDCDMEIIVS